MRYFKATFLSLFLLVITACGQTAVPDPTSTSPPAPTVTATAVPPPAAYEQIPGIYLGRFHGSSSPGTKLEADIGKGIAYQLHYLNWNNPFNPGIYNANKAVGRMSYITWEYQNGRATDLQAILNGEHDEYIGRWADGMAQLDMPVMLRWGHEMNGDWYGWSGVRNGGGQLDGFGDPAKADGPERYVAAYQYIHQRFAEAGADNVLWVWCPNAPISTMTAVHGEWNEAANYYPGDEYVDWLCLDGYNWGESAFGQQFGSSWQSFDQIFGESYAQLQSLNADKPIIIGEFASTEEGGDKAAWILDTYQTIAANYPQIRAVTWFHVTKETDWRIDSSPESLEAFATAVADDIWLDQIDLTLDN